MTKEEAAYLAGIIDADGYICIKRQIHPGYKRGVLFRPRVGVAGTFLPLLEWVKEKTETGFIENKPMYSKNRRKSYRWETWSTQEILRILREIDPFLIVKKRHSQFLQQAFLNTVYARITDNVHETRRKAYEALRTIQIRGVGNVRAHGSDAPR